MSYAKFRDGVKHSIICQKQIWNSVVLIHHAVDLKHIARNKAPTRSVQWMYIPEWQDAIEQESIPFREAVHTEIAEPWLN